MALAISYTAVRWPIGISPQPRYRGWGLIPIPHIPGSQGIGVPDPPDPQIGGLGEGPQIGGPKPHSYIGAPDGRQCDLGPLDPPKRGPKGGPKPPILTPF